MSNLDIAFPEKTLAEKKIIAKQFYKNMVDSFIETVKLLSITKQQLLRRFVWNEEIINAYYNSGRNVQLHLGHFFNWEYANHVLSLKSAYPALVVYMPVKNKTFDKLFIKMRTRFNAKMIAATRFRSDFSAYIKGRYCMVFVADQNAGNTDKAYWSIFLNKLAPFVTGPEKNARLTDSVVLFVKFLKLKRGYYTADFIKLTEEPRKLKEGTLTRLMIEQIEASVHENPSNYLWSHRRWKRRFNAEKHTQLIIH